MKLLRHLILFLALFGAVVAPSRVHARTAASFDFFYDSLAPYGDWIQVGDYGLCWTPTHVDPDWSPYSDGYWAFTDAGWTWVSYEDFGPIVYHYGRWIHLDDGQWCWNPDYEWAPAWVSWRYSRDYVGWAPLPPEARWRRDVGFSVWVDNVYDLGPGRYSFCHVRDFGAPVLRGVIINREENLACMRGTVNVTNMTYNTDYADGPVIFNGGPSFEVINEVSARPIPAMKLVLDPGFDAAHWREHRGPGGRMAFNAHTVGNQLIVAAPLVAPPTDPSAFKSRVKTVIPAKKVNDGWAKVKNPEQYREEFRRQANGLTPETAPARPVAAADLHVVPLKADPHATPSVTAERHGKPDKGQRPESVVAQPNNVPPNVPSTTPPTTADRHEKPGKGQHPESVVTPPNDVPPASPTAGNPLLKPFNAAPGSEPKPKSQNAPTAAFTPNPRGQAALEQPTPGHNPPRAADSTAQDHAAEQAKIRAEQDRIAQQKQAEMANQQRQAEIAAQQQQKQAEAGKQQHQAEIAAQQQKQISAQQEAAKMQAEASRRHEIETQQQVQQQQKAQVQQPQQQVQPRGPDPRKAQEAEREKQIEAQHAAQVHEKQQAQSQHPPQPQPQPQQHSNPPTPSQAQPANNAQHAKDAKDKKDKDKDKDKNGN